MCNWTCSGSTRCLFQRHSRVPTVLADCFSPAFAMSATKENTTYPVPASVFSFKTFTFNIYFEENFLELLLSFNYLSCHFFKCKLLSLASHCILSTWTSITVGWFVLTWRALFDSILLLMLAYCVIQFKNVNCMAFHEYPTILLQPIYLQKIFIRRFKLKKHHRCPNSVGT